MYLLNEVKILSGKEVGMKEFIEKQEVFQKAKWGSYVILPLHNNPNGKSNMARSEAIRLLKKQSEVGNQVFTIEIIDTSDLSDLMTSRCKNYGDFMDQYRIQCDLSKLYFSEDKREYIEPKDIHLFYFPESELAFLVILLVNQDFSVDNFYELANPGYILDYKKIETLREKFSQEVKEKILYGILKELNFDIYILDDNTDIFRESYWFNAAIVSTRFKKLETLERLSYNAHRFIPLETEFEDSSEKDIRYVFGAKDVKQHDYRWGCCVSSQSISYVYGKDPDITDSVETKSSFEDYIWIHVKSDLPLTIIALFQKYVCIKINDLIYEKIKTGSHKEENIREIKREVLKVRAYETYTPSQISRWNNVCEIYRLLLEINGVNDYMKDIQDKVDLLDEELDRVSAERENKIMNIIALFGALSIIASVLTIVDFIKGSPIDMGILSVVVVVLVVSVIWKMVLKERKGNK